MSGDSERDAVLAYAPLEPLMAAVRNQASADARYPLIALALRAAQHPALAPYRADPTLPLAGKFPSLEARIGALRSVLQSQEPPRETLGTVGGALYLPARQEAVACVVRVAYLRDTASLDHWEAPTSLHPISPALAASAQKAFEIALHQALFEYPCPVPPTPARLFWSIEGELSDDILAATSGDSLEVPLTLAFLSVLTGLPVPSGVGATGAVRSKGSIGKVGYVREKSEAYRTTHEEQARFFTPDDGTNIAQIAAKINAAWHAQFTERPRYEQEPITVVGVPTFLWAEIENAPALWQEHARIFRAALVQYRKLLADAVYRHGGNLFAEVAGAGEGMGAVFPTPEQTVQAAVFLLRSVRAALWEPVLGSALPVRVGLHQGSGEPRGNNGWRGAGPAGAARIAGAASAGQILASEAMHHAAAAAGVWYELGAHRLRDFSGAVNLWQVGGDGLPTVFAPPDSLNTRRHNLPLADTPLIGREGIADKLLALLAKKRLVTLIGAGGVGKTRLAVAVAADALLNPLTENRFPDGAFYIALDTIEPTDAALSGAVCEAVGIPVKAGSAEELAAKSLLLVLDNAESMTAVAAQFVRKLQATAPHVICLVTSRVPLKVPGETREMVPPLDLPEAGSGSAEWQNAPAVRLFLERAHTADPAFAVTGENERDTVTRLLHRLDGLPLAIELAAARTKQLPLTSIETRLSESFKLLSTRQADVPERQQTLLGTIEWSYGLLSPQEQLLLRRIAVFVGGFSAEAAEAITDHDPDTLDDLEALEEQGLLVCRRPESGDPPRFVLLQTVLDFAQEKLRDRESERVAVQRAYSDYYAKLVAQHGSLKTRLSEKETESFDILDREMANLRSAWAFWREQGDLESQAELAANLSDFLRRRGHTRERSEWVETALAANATMKPETHYRLLHAYAITLKDTGRIAEAEATAETLAILCEQGQDKQWIGEAAYIRGTVATRAKRFAEAEVFFKQASRNYAAARDLSGIVSVLVNRSMNAIRAGDKKQARQLCEKAVRIGSLVGDEHHTAYSHNNLGYLDIEERDYVSAYHHFQHQLLYCRKQRDTTGVAIVSFNIGEALLHLKEVRGMSLMVAASELFSRLGNSYAAMATSETDDWARRFDLSAAEIAALRRTANRSTLAQLRATPVADLPVMPNRDLTL